MFLGRLGLWSLLLGFSVVAFVAQAAVETGKPAPNFTLSDLNGKKVSLEQFRGKTVVLEWLNFDCPFVKKHYSGKNMQSIQADAKKDGIIWLSIVSSAPGKQGYYEPKAMAERAKQEGSNAQALLLDSTGTVGKSYGAKTTPHMYIVDSKGVLVYQGAIDDKASTDLEDLRGAKNHVRLALDEIKAGKKVSVSDTTPYGCGVKYAH